MIWARPGTATSTTLTLGLVAAFVLACGDSSSQDTEATSTATTTAEPGTGTTATTTAEPGTGTTAVPTTGTASDTTSDTGDAGSFCSHQCAVDMDCQIGGLDVGLTCQSNLCVFADEDLSCTNDECVALFSVWETPCTSGGGECDGLGQRCVKVDDGGACATMPSDMVSCDESPGFVELEVPDIDGNLVTVCGFPTAECHEDGFCFSPCNSDDDCLTLAYPICDTGTGFCQCGTDADCATIGSPNLSACVAGTCGCGADQQCVDGGVGDVCNADGTCGCSDNAACSSLVNGFDGGAIACVKP